MEDLWSELESFGNDNSIEIHKVKAVQALKQIETWNLFNVTSYEGLTSSLSSTSLLLFLSFAKLVSATGVEYQVEPLSPKYNATCIIQFEPLALKH
ncbi:hypothetical protein Tco_0694423 [Tanacetum coccineum]